MYAGINFRPGGYLQVLSQSVLRCGTPLHGYGIMQRVDEMSSGRVKLAAGTLYGALNTLKERGWITLEGGADGRRKDYAITEKGKEVLLAELARLKELVQNGEKVLEGK